MKRHSLHYASPTQLDAEALTRQLRGHWQGSQGKACCPAHDDRNPSLSIRDGENGLLLHCFAGCNYRDIWRALQARGILPNASPPSPSTGRRSEGGEISANTKTRFAREIWDETQPAAHSLAAEYLLGRGLTLSLPPALRFHPNLKHGPSEKRFPALVAAVTGPDGHMQAIQRIFLAHDGRSKAPIKPAKMSLGPVSGGHVALAKPTDRIWVTEGIEDALAVMQMFKDPAWALLGTSNFPTCVIPEGVDTVVLAPDHDAAGQEIIEKSGQRLSDLGRQVRIARPPAGQDWCDLLGEFDERAAVLQFDLGLSRADAEDAALKTLLGLL